MTDKKFDFGDASTVRFITPHHTPQFYTQEYVNQLKAEKEQPLCEVHVLEDTPKLRTLMNAYETKGSKKRRRKALGSPTKGNRVILDMSSSLYKRIGDKIAEVQAVEKSKRDNWKARYKKPTKRNKH